MASSGSMHPPVANSSGVTSQQFAHQFSNIHMNSTTLPSNLGPSINSTASAGGNTSISNIAGPGIDLAGPAAGGSIGMVQPASNPVARLGSIEFTDASFFWLERHLRSNKLRLSVTEQLGKVGLCYSQNAEQWVRNGM
jgi:hypothetical protein